jgi:hypothetical protein
MGAFSRGVLLGMAGLALVIQFIRPARTNPPIDPSRTLESAVTVPPQEAKILSRACADCHSNQTIWPWYSNIAPASWLVIDHVNQGRRHMNFSAWLRPGIDDPAQYTRQKFRSACNRVKTGNMPLLSYLLLHPSARLSPVDVDAICGWADGLQQSN